ncbi:uncharacterized protein LOC120486774 [Pimephales promelas]|uniref:uncharacterized protein LOC120486774 n=1 Tax=Pimephales promelas TaxID=90988 RepID=UPI0019556521|nr:uncharacterized protein LOC120486774 [Pimephales promelas]
MAQSVRGASGADTETVSVFVMEGDSVTLNTGVKTNQQEYIKWYFNNIRIVQITVDQSKICTDDQCNEGTERFRDRLKLDHQTGSLTITNTTNKHSGEYKLVIINGSNNETIFSVTVTGVSVAEQDEVKRKTVKEGQSVTLATYVIKSPNYVVLWYYNDILIAEITGDQSQICTDVQCKERFRDRLKLDHQTGSLNITHTTNTDSGVYKLQINIRRISIIRSFDVTVSIKSSAVNVTGSGVSSAAGICVGVAVVVLLVVAAVASVNYRRHRKPTQAGHNGFTRENNHDERNDAENSIPLSKMFSADPC